MSILIKGMDMPKPDTFDNIIIHSNGQVAMPFWGKGMQAAEGIEAQQLPPHGDLIDREKLLELCDMMADKCGDFSMWKQFRTVAEDLPTVIEA